MTELSTHNDFKNAAEPAGQVPAISIAAFWETEPLRDCLVSATGDRRMSRARAEVFPGGIRAASELYRARQSPDLLILESGADRSALFADLEQLSEVCLPETRVLIVGHVNDVNIYRDLFSHGVSDYLVTPLEPLDLVAAVARAFPQAPDGKRGRIVTFVGARGGSGSSVVAQNVAWQAATKLEADLLLADLDVTFGTAALGFNLEPGQNSLIEALQNADRLDEALLERLVARPHPKLGILGAQAAIDATSEAVQPKLETALDTVRRHFNLTILDVPHGWSGWEKTALTLPDDIVITATPDLASLRNAKMLLAFLKEARPNDPLPKLVLTQVRMPKQPQITPARFAEALDLKPIACLPFDPKPFGTAANEGRMLDQVRGGAKIANLLLPLSKTLVGGKEKARPRRSAGFLGRLWARRAS